MKTFNLIFNIWFENVLDYFVFYRANITNVLLPIGVSITKLAIGPNRYYKNIQNIVDNFSSFIYFLYVLALFVIINLIILIFALSIIFFIPLLISFSYNLIYWIFSFIINEFYLNIINNIIVITYQICCAMVIIIFMLIWLLWKRINRVDLNIIKQTQNLP